MPKFKKKPVVIEAVQFSGKRTPDLEKLFHPRKFPLLLDDREVEGGMVLLIPTLEGVMKAKPGDWIIRGVNGEFYPCKPDIFEKTYEPVEEDN